MFVSSCVFLCHLLSGAEVSRHFAAFATVSITSLDRKYAYKEQIKGDGETQ